MSFAIYGPRSVTFSKTAMYGRLLANHQARISQAAAEYLGSQYVVWAIDKDRGIAVLVPHDETGYIVNKRSDNEQYRMIYSKPMTDVLGRPDSPMFKLVPFPEHHPKALRLVFGVYENAEDQPARNVGVKRAAGREAIRAAVLSCKSSPTMSAAMRAEQAKKYDLTEAEVRTTFECAAQEWAAEQRNRRMEQ